MTGKAIRAQHHGNDINNVWGPIVVCCSVAVGPNIKPSLLVSQLSVTSDQQALISVCETTRKRNTRSVEEVHTGKTMEKMLGVDRTTGYTSRGEESCRWQTYAEFTFSSE